MSCLRPESRLIMPVIVFLQVINITVKYQLQTRSYDHYTILTIIRFVLLIMRIISGAHSCTGKNI